MEVEYGPALPPGLGVDHNASDQHSDATDEPSKVASVKPKKKSHSHKKHASDTRSTSDQSSDESDVRRRSSK